MTGLFLTRRGLLLSASAAALVAALPEAIEAVAPIGPEPITAAKLQAFAVGTPGEFDWQHIVAETADEACKLWLEDHGYDDEDCHDVEATRVEAWDALKGESTPADWFKAGFGHICSRCGYECHPETGARAVDNEAVCDDCLTLLDRAVTDPEQVVEDLENRIADEGEEDVRAWLEAKGWWNDLPLELWNQAVARATLEPA